MSRLLFSWLLLSFLMACSNRPLEYSRQSFNGPLQCAPYARSKTHVALHGAAASWWRQAVRKYRRVHTPHKGSLLVFRPTRRIPSGHVAIVRRVVSKRKILVEHANWEPGRIDRDVPVVDVSRQNNWTVVRVYWAPARHLGARAYAAYGFIEPNGRK